MLVCAVALAAAAPSGARVSDPAGVRIHQAASGGAAEFWTPARLRRAEPLATPPIDATPARVAARASDQAAASRLPAGTTPSRPKAFPNGANGVVFGRMDTGSGSQLFRCSGAVVNSRAKDLAITAGHCVIDADTGAAASELIFVPGYRHGAEPFGEWAASSFATTSRWERTAGGDPDEAGDVAFLRIAHRRSGGARVGRVVGALGIGFNRRRRQSYTQYGYPAEPPYGGSVLYRLRSAFVAGDPSFSPATMAIASDFTPGASGGPWTVGRRSPTVLSVTDYSYQQAPGYLFGPYFGAAIRNLYGAVGGRRSGAVAVRPLRG